MNLFTLPVKKKKSRKLHNSTVTINNRQFHIEQVSSREWEGWFADNHAVTFVTPTKRELLEDAHADGDGKDHFRKTA